jgi:hypothetical protein
LGGQTIFFLTQALGQIPCGVYHVVLGCGSVYSYLGLPIPKVPNQKKLWLPFFGVASQDRKIARA